MPPKETKKLNCGLIMPISAIDGCPAEHWLEVKSIITEAVASIPDPVFTVRLVSDADAIGVIQKRIVQNVYSSDVVVCDVSGKNPNVMFELGLRLAFDKAAVIVKDDKTDYSFDTSIIEHVQYPRDLRFQKVVDFKAILAQKVMATHKEASVNSEHSPFLKNFGDFRVASLSQTEVTPDKMILEMLSDLQTQVSMLRHERAPFFSRRGFRNESNLTEVTARILAAMVRFQQMENIDSPEILLGYDKFHKYAERAADAPHYFLNYDAFRETVDSLVKEFILAQQAIGKQS